MTVGILAAGVLVGLTGAVTEVWQVVLLLFGIGWFITPLQASVVTIMQTNVPDAARGRVMATLQAAMSGASVASMALAGCSATCSGSARCSSRRGHRHQRRDPAGRPVSLRDRAAAPVAAQPRPGAGRTCGSTEQLVTGPEGAGLGGLSWRRPAIRRRSSTGSR